MCQHEWEIVAVARGRIGARLPDGRIVDLQAAHIEQRGTSCPHLRDATAFRLSASYGADLVNELLRACS